MLFLEYIIEPILGKYKMNKKIIGIFDLLLAFFSYL